MSQAEIIWTERKRFNGLTRISQGADPALKRRPAADVSVARAGWSSRFFPSSAAPLHLPHAAGSFGLRARSSGLAAGASPAAAGSTPDASDAAVATELGSGRPVRPDRLGRSCRFLVPIERREPPGEMVQDWLVGDADELLHAASHSVAILTTGSGETASTLKIVRDAVGEAATMRPPERWAAMRRPHRES